MGHLPKGCLIGGQFEVTEKTQEAGDANRLSMCVHLSSIPSPVQGVLHFMNKKTEEIACLEHFFLYVVYILFLRK